MLSGSKRQSDPRPRTTKHPARRYQRVYFPGHVLTPSLPLGSVQHDRVARTLLRRKHPRPPISGLPESDRPYHSDNRNRQGVHGVGVWRRELAHQSPRCELFENPSKDHPKKLLSLLHPWREPLFYLGRVVYARIIRHVVPHNADRDTPRPPQPSAL